ncbi:hypothetical protein Glove_123g21 [Diversispora epigaea]|uniref:Uncharacterized protein n=2 Tax=Diversispora epigaea TaxID=1348612 RepID=A0A397IYK5_9GLOM|nr:hypothetical protein Glove_123g21 [Diversispora epigaea]
MNKFIPIFLINLTPLQFDESVNSEIHIDDLEIINNIQESIGKGGRRNIIDILKFLIPNLLKQKILNISNPEIHLRISGDENHHTIILYPGIEKYEILQVALEQLIIELRTLKEKDLKDHQGREWKIELYFSSDWKFLAICLGLNAANRHIRPAIFDMIPLQNWVPDKLHIMLRITDVLWRLVIDELKFRNTWVNKARDVIIEEMKCINVRFHFWLEVGSSTWQYTSLMGQDKLTVLQHFNLSTFKSNPNSKFMG